MIEQKTPYISFRSFRKSGAPVDTPVWFAANEQGHFFLFSASNAGKVKRVRNSEKAQIAKCDARGGSVEDWHDCRAFIVNNEAEEQAAYRLLIDKYGWQMRITNFFSRLSGRINNRTVIRMEF